MNHKLPQGYVVMCGAIPEHILGEEGTESLHVLATRRVFSSLEEARTYAGECNPSRNAVVVPTAQFQRLMDGWYPAPVKGE